MALAGTYLATLFAFLAIDFVGIRFMILPLFQRHVADLLRAEPLFAVAGGFYLLYVVGVMYFAVLPAVREQNVGVALGNGALLGLVAYGTCEFTNMSTVRGWAWQMVVTDTLWGLTLTAVSAAIGYFVGRALMS
jgi:uncharacterized membrane protein